MEKSIFLEKAKRLSLTALILLIVVFAINFYIGLNQVSILTAYGMDVYPIDAYCNYYNYIFIGPTIMLALSLVAFLGISMMKKPNIGFAVIFSILFCLVFVLHSVDLIKPTEYRLYLFDGFWESYSRLASCSDCYTKFPMVLSVAFFCMAMGMIIGGRCEAKDKFKGASFKISAILMLIIILVKIVLNFDQKGIATKFGAGKLEEIEPWPIYGLLDSTIPICLLVVFVMTIIANRILKKEGLFAVLISIVTTMVIQADYFISPIFSEVLGNSVSERSAFIITLVNIYIDKYALWFFNISLILFFVGNGINYACSLKTGLDNKVVESVQ